MECEKTVLKLEAYELGFLEGSERRQVEGHLRACPACRETLAEVRRTVEILERLPTAAAIERAPEAPPALPGRPAGTGTRRLALGLGVAAAWLLAVGLGAAAMALALGRGDGGEADRLAAFSRLIEGQERLLGELEAAQAENVRLRRASEDLRARAADLGERLDRLAARAGGGDNPPPAPEEPEARSAAEPSPESPPVYPRTAPAAAEPRTPWDAAYRLVTGLIDDRGMGIHRRTRAYQKELARLYGGKD